ncbi:MAG TPA: hypothetical protein VF942_00645, partial [Acidimicrobiales bacterium]
ELLALQGDVAGAVVAIERALEVAVSQGAHWLGLRAACSFARHAPGPIAFQRLETARKNVIGGADSPDVQAAVALLGGQG